MLILSGSPALSAFRKEKLLESLTGISAISARYVHFVALKSPLSNEQQQVLEGLLQYGPSLEEDDVEGQRFVVVPRPGTISPWSSKATDICHNAGLTQVDGTLSAKVPYVALDTFAYDSAGRIYYQVNDIDQKLISGYENLPGPPPGTPRTDDYPALARFYNAKYQGQEVRVVSLLNAVSEPNMNGMAEIRVAETDEARVSMARSLMADTLLRLGMDRKKAKYYKPFLRSALYLLLHIIPL
jgi:hypothetical protein